MWLVLINVVVYVINMFGGEQFSLNDLGALRANLIEEPWNAYQLITSGFLHADLRSRIGIFHILFNMYGLWMFGRDVEAKYGRYEFAFFYMVAIVVSGLVWVSWETAFARQFWADGLVPSCLGASGGVMGVIILYCLSFPQRDLYLFALVRMKAWMVGLMFVGLDLFQAMSHADGQVAWQAHLGGAAFALFYWFTRIRFSSLIRPEWFDRKPNLKLHNPENPERLAYLDSEADRILEKIGSEGEDSLTSKERRILADYSKRMREKHQ